VLAALALILLAAPANDDALLQTVSSLASIARPGSPGPVALVGERAFPVVVAGDRRTTRAAVGAAHYRSGRLVAYGHDGYLGGAGVSHEDTAKLLVASADWAASGGKRAVVVRAPEMAALLSRNGFTVLETATLPRDFEAANLLVASMGVPLDAEGSAAIRRFVAGGGGLVTAGLGWGWLQLNSGKRLNEMSWNRVIGPMGLAFADGTVGPPLLQQRDDAGAHNALLALRRHDAGQKLAQDAAIIAEAYRAVPPDAPYALEARRLVESVGPVGPTPQRPYGAAHALERLALVVQAEGTDPAGAATGSDAFPGAVPAAERRVRQEVRLNLAVPGWAGTGLYAPPGETIRVTGAPEGVTIQIGAHADHLWHHDEWKRHPQIVRRFPASATVEARNPFGGLVYVDVPNGRQGTADVVIEGAVRAPRFVLGRTTNASWKSVELASNAPWTELETSKVILTVPTEAARQIQDPEALMRFWDRTMDLFEDLGQRPLPARPERIVADVQISAGYMHAGYPIMTHLEAGSYGTNLRFLTTEGSWGHWHEIGHNHQQPEWTWDGTGEVTCNLFTLYCMQNLAGQGLWSRVGQSRPKMLQHIQSGAPYEAWKADPFLALYMYTQLIDAFGWEPMKKVFAQYRDLPANQRPRTDLEKRSQWMVRYSRTINRNLGPFFQKWGVPTTEEARRSIADLPEWMPEF
jgi:hypothetical protein